MKRRPRRREQRGRSLVGETFDVEVGPVAHGGHCVARHDGRVVFVRHALPGEQVTVRVTEGDEGSRFLRADAVDVRTKSPDRVEAPCPYAGPDACGGCDFQHVALPAQRSLKAAVVAEQMRRLAGLDVQVDVEPVPGDEQGLRWRTRVQLAVDRQGRTGLRKHRSHQVVPVDDCLISRKDARVVVEGQQPSGGTVVGHGTVVGQGTVVEPVETPPGPETAVGHSGVVGQGTVVEPVETPAGRHEFQVAADGFWQVHPGAPHTLVEVVLSMLRPRAGERCLDLYSGVGLFSAFLADAVGPDGAVHAIEGDKVAAEHARHNLAAYPSVAVHRGSVDRWLVERAPAGSPEVIPEKVDLVVLDPPREGAKRTVVEQVAARAPRAVAYVACDPAALARDVALFAEQGYRLEALRAFDLFPMTHHVECVALLRQTSSDLR